jgi:hypothetical protein
VCRRPIEEEPVKPAKAADFAPEHPAHQTTGTGDCS